MIIEYIRFTNNPSWDNRIESNLSEQLSLSMADANLQTDAPEIITDEQAFWNTPPISVLLLTPQQATRLVNEDIYTTMRLGPLDDETISSCFNAATRLSAGKCSWVYTIRDWIRERQTIVGYGNVSSTDFSMIQLEHMLKKAGEVQKRPEQSFASSGKDIKTTDPWNSKPAEWCKKKCEFIAYQSMKKNRNGVPLSYLLRDDTMMIEEEGNTHTTTDGNIQSMISHAALEGDTFNADNYNLFELLVAWTSGGTGEAFVDRFAVTTNGQGAWKQLFLANEGTNSCNARIQKAEHNISRAFWEGNRHN